MHKTTAPALAEATGDPPFAPLLFANLALLPATGLWAMTRAESA